LNVIKIMEVVYCTKKKKYEKNKKKILAAIHVRQL